MYTCQYQGENQMALDTECGKPAVSWDVWQFNIVCQKHLDKSIIEQERIDKAFYETVKVKPV